MYHAGAAALVAVCLAWGVLLAAAVQEPQARFSAEVQLVEIYATVTDGEGELVTGLQRSDFNIDEDGRRQEIAVFAAGEFPLTVVLGVDRSWSMAGEPLRLAKEASRAFLGQLTPADRSMVVAIGNEAEVIAPLSTGQAEQLRVLDALDPWSTTALHDAIIATLDRLDGEPGRLAVVVFSDGIDRYSTAPAARVVERARRSPALIYPITIGKVRSPLAAELAVVTGGRSFLLRDARALDSTFASIARELRDQYLIGYVPSSSGRQGEPAWRSVRVQVKGRPAFRVRARDGYMTQ